MRQVASGGGRLSAPSAGSTWSRSRTGRSAWRPAPDARTGSPARPGSPVLEGTPAPRSSRRPRRAAASPGSSRAAPWPAPWSRRRGRDARRSRTSGRSSGCRWAGACSRLSDEYPVPKSSIAILNPASWSVCRISRVRSGSVMAVDSVISIVTFAGGSTPAVSNVSQDLLGEMGRPQLTRRHVEPDLQIEARVAHASPAGTSRRSPNDRSRSINPISSASGMNSPGGIRNPRSR